MISLAGLPPFGGGFDLRKPDRAAKLAAKLEALPSWDSFMSERPDADDGQTEAEASTANVNATKPYGKRRTTT